MCTVFRLLPNTRTGAGLFSQLNQNFSQSVDWTEHSHLQWLQRPYGLRKKPDQHAELATAERPRQSIPETKHLPETMPRWWR